MVLGLVGWPVVGQSRGSRLVAGSKWKEEQEGGERVGVVEVVVEVVVVAVFVFVVVVEEGKVDTEVCWLSAAAAASRDTIQFNLKN